MNVIKSIYNFIVGDMIILVGTIIALIVLAAIHYIPPLAPLQVASGVILIVAVLAVLITTLNREARGKR
ncbi:MAG TPA: hypothetical protein VKR06_33110 [Ktedonosporobacter sp.]|nr:hypothetical protein [Ktedonosporobacter sp.]